MTDERWDSECEVLVAGSGAGALTGALTAATNGLHTMVIEKTDVFGGTTAYSGGGLWLPNNRVELGSVDDTPEKARAYVDATVGDRTPVALQDAFLATGAKLVDFLDENPRLEFEWRSFPDYFPADGRFPQGRTIHAKVIAADDLGDLLPHLRLPLPSERDGLPRGDVLDGGQALIARLLLALRDAGVTLSLQTALDRLVVDDHGAVIGVEAVLNGERIRIRADRGVLMACGGFERNEELRRRYQPDLAGVWTFGSPGNTGDALQSAMDIGAATDLLDESWWSGGILRPDGAPIFLIGVRSGIIVNGAGRRFTNESLPYDRFGHEMRRGQETGVSHFPSYLIMDQTAVDREGVGGMMGIPPGGNIPEEWLETGALKRADTLAELAAQLDIPAANLVATVEEFNGFARTGVDEHFHRGEDPFDVFFSDPADPAPNPVLKPIADGPFYAATVVLSDLGTKGGPITDEHARVLREDGQPIPGLYAAGNTMASWTGHVYPGPGSPIGSCMVFSFLAALDMVDRARQPETGVVSGGGRD